MDTGVPPTPRRPEESISYAPPQLGLLLCFLGDDCLLIELMSHILILLIKHGATSAQQAQGHGHSQAQPKTFATSCWLLSQSLL